MLPDGCADLVWDGHDLVVVGASTVAVRFPVSAESRNIGLRLRPGAAGAVLGCRACELPVGAVRLDLLWGPAGRRLEDMLHEAGGAVRQHRLLEEHVAGRLRAGADIDRAVVQAARMLQRPTATVDSVAAAVGLSPRGLRRRFLAHVGYGPKAFHRVLRFQNFLRHGRDLVSGDAPLAAAAARAGYADQSHLGRECLRLSGSSPAALLDRRAGRRRAGRNVPDTG